MWIKKIPAHKTYSEANEITQTFLLNTYFVTGVSADVPVMQKQSYRF